MKYHNVPTTIDNIRFDSKKEATRYGELLLLQKVGEISDLEMQVKYPLVVNGHKVAVYIADFVYNDREGLRHVEDVKSAITRKNAVYRLKKKLMQACHSITIEEI